MLLVSCAHALVHVFELSLPSAEQLIGAQFQVGRQTTGLLGLAWRLPFGLGAVAAGWLADRLGSKPMILLYLLGCAGTAVMACLSTTLASVFVALFVMGTFASIYHPAGLSWISRVTTRENRARALGWHGIIGAVGIAGAPFLAGLVFSFFGPNWHVYYLVLAAGGLVVAILLAACLPAERSEEKPVAPSVAQPPISEPARWGAFALLLAIGALMGLVYSGFIYFLPRFLDQAGLSHLPPERAGHGDYLAALVMACAVIGQALSGRLARHERLETFQSVILFATAPLLLSMSFAQGRMRVVAAAAVALVQFMHQPVYNSLVAKYVPTTRLSLGYGVSNMIGFGIGALGPVYAGFAPSFSVLYAGLAIIVSLGGVLALGLKRLHE